MSDTDTIITNLQDNVFTIVINRPKVNALSLDLMEGLLAAFKQAERDEKARCVLLTGAGDNFSAGQDITVFGENLDIPFRFHMLRIYNPLILQIRRLEKPVLAAINGICSGAALGIALSCDLRIAAKGARFIVGFTGIGLVPDSAVSLLLPSLIGLGRASEITFSNASISTENALAWGLINRVVKASDLMKEAHSMAVQLARGPIHTMGLAKRLFNKAVLGDLEHVLDYEAHLQEIAGHSPEHREGVQAFLEKRPPKFL